MADVRKLRRLPVEWENVEGFPYTTREDLVGFVPDELIEEIPEDDWRYMGPHSIMLKPEPGADDQAFTVYPADQGGHWIIKSSDGKFWATMDPINTNQFKDVTEETSA